MAFLDLKIVLVAFVWLVDELECHCRCLKPFSTITNRPNGIRFRKFTHKSLNKWIAGISSLCAINKSKNWRFPEFVWCGKKALVSDARCYPGSDVCDFHDWALRLSVQTRGIIRRSVARGRYCKGRGARIGECTT